MKVILVMAQTLDGKIARSSDHFPDWTGAEDKKFFAEKSRGIGVMIFGRQTFETLPGLLPGRLHVVMSRKARKWEEKSKNLIMTCLRPSEILRKLEALGFREVLLGGGRVINSLFAEKSLIDEIFVTVSPLVFGKGLGIFRENIALDLSLVNCKNISNEVMLFHYKVKK